MPDLLQIYIIINIFIIGTLFGSFFTLATYRIPRKEDIVFKRSYCPNCKHELGFFDLIPVLSYVFLFGKCRYCKNRISIRYPLFEILNGFIFIMLFIIFGFEIYFFIAISIYIYLFLLTGSYLTNKKIINNERRKLKTDEYLKVKSGFFSIEIGIAFLAFAIFLTSTFITSRNYLNQSIDLIARNNAIASCIKNLEIALATEYDILDSFENSEMIEGIMYTTNISVEKYSQENPDAEDYIKTLNAIVEYELNGKAFNFEINTLKKKVNR